MYEPPAALRVLPAASRFFDWASLSPLCSGAVEGQERHLRAAAAAIDAPAEMRRSTDLASLRETVRSFVLASPDHDVVLGRSASEFLSLFAHGLATDQGRREIILLGPNHPCLPIAWMSAARYRGLRVRDLPPLGTREIDMEAFNENLDERCAAVLVTHVDHLHGVVQPIDQVVELAHAVGASVIVDGAQAVGRIPIDLAAMGADAYIGVGRKALMSPIGTAFLVADRSLLERTQPLVWSTRSASLDASDRVVPAPSPTHLEGNLPDLGALMGLHEVLLAYGRETLQALQRHVQISVPALLDGFAEVGLEPLSPPVTGNAGILSFRLPPSTSGSQLQDKLRRAGLVVAAGSTEFRVSIHLANGDDDIESLIRKVREYA